MDDKKARRKCVICGNERVRLFQRIKMALPEEITLPKEYDVVKCNQCGFCFADTEATMEDYDRYYSNNNSYSGTPVNTTVWDELNESAYSIMKEYISEQDNILDMGFGKGVFLEYLKHKGFCNVFGLDPSFDSVNRMRLAGYDVQVGSVFETAPEHFSHQMKCIMLFDVVEHLLEPNKALISLKSYLSISGYLILSVPNYGSIADNITPIPNQFNQEHINYFSDISIENLMRKCGYIKKKHIHIRNGEEIVAIYQLREESKTDYQAMMNGVKFEEESGKAIEIYLSQQDKNCEKRNHVFQQLKSKHIDGVYVWGVGAYTMWLLENSQLSNMAQIWYVDNNPTKIGKEFQGKEIISPKDIIFDYPILICSMLYSQKIINQIREMKLGNEVYVL